MNLRGKRSRSRVLGLCALLLCLVLPAVEAQPAFQVADINTTQPDILEPLFLFQDFAVLGTELFFLADDGIHGIELWKTDGTAAGTTMVKDICPGSCWGRSFNPTIIGGVLYFVADDGAHGFELWRSDGTAAGTFLVKDIFPGLQGRVSLLREVAGLLFFSADDGVHGDEPWTTDGTDVGTRMVADVQPGPQGSEPWPRLAVNGGLLFSANDGVHGTEPWWTDGTAAGTRMIRDIVPGPGGSSAGINPTASEPDALVLPNGSFLLTAYDATHGLELWSSDGTEAGTALVTDINPGPEDSSPFGLTLLGSTVFFTAYEPTTEWELWKTDGTAAGTALVKDLNPLHGSSPREMRAFGGRLFFRAGHETLGSELWTSDGTEAGTFVVKDVNPGSGDGLTFYNRNLLGGIGGSLFFSANDGVHGLELWKTDGTEAGTVLVKDILPGALPSFFWYVSPSKALGSHLYFYANGPDGPELWKSDGSEAGTSQVKDISNLHSSIWSFNGFLWGTTSTLGGDFVFPADDGTSGLEPWRSDGTVAGTQPIADLLPGPDGSFPDGMARSGNRLLISADGLWSTDGTAAGTTSLLSSAYDSTGATGLVPALGTVFFSGAEAGSDEYELWRTDGTPAGTVRVKDIRAGSASSYPGWMVPLGSTVLFTADDGTNGIELWATNGTAAGTVLLKDLVPGAGSSSPNRLTRVGGEILFFATDAANGQELWKTDGTAAGTALVKDIRPGTSSSISYQEPVAIGTTFFFFADDGVSGVELWKSDGTAAGTVFVKDVFPGALSSDPEHLTRVRDRVFFVADDGVHGRELWMSDGTAAGTRMVEDVLPGASSSVPWNLKAVGHVLLFSAFDGIHGVELWVSDGTEAGTRLLQDIAPGALPASPLAFTPAGDKVWFAANDGIAGFEPWLLPRQALGSTFADVPPGHWAWLAVEALADAGITRGCAAGTYCPTTLLTRSQTATFLGRAIHFEGYAPPPATGTRFDDVPASHPNGAWIEQIAHDGFTQGCSASPPRFCPDAQLSRAEMAILLLRAKHGGSYAPPPATGTRFEDVPATHWAAPWIEQLATEGISLGCTATRFCPGNLVTRAEMAVFLDRTFELSAR
jgi:ELWxxDGT repeat protein